MPGQSTRSSNVSTRPRGTSRSADRADSWNGRVGQVPLILLLLGFALAARVVMAVVLPPWQSPDEPKHFEYVRLVVDLRDDLLAQHRILRLSDARPVLQQQIIASMAANHFWPYLGQKTPNPLPSGFRSIWPEGTDTQLHRPSVYYYVSAAFLLPFAGQPIEQQLLVVRLISALLSTLTVWLVYLAGRELRTDDRFIALGAAALVAALPMHIFIGGAVNTDNIVSLVGALFALVVAAGLRRGLDWRWCAVLAGVFILGLAAKRTAVGLLPPLLLVLLMWLTAGRGRGWSYARIALVAGCVLVGVGFGSGLFQRLPVVGSLRNLVITYALNYPGQVDALLQGPLRQASTWTLVQNQLAMLFRSFWGLFGWFSVPLSVELYTALAGLVGAGAAGLLGWLIVELARLWRKPTPERSRQLLTMLVYLVMIASMVVLAVGERLAYFSARDVPQGRYLFVTITPLALTLLVGLRAYLPQRLVGTRWPSVIASGLLVAFAVVVYTAYILPAYAWRSFT